MDGSAAPARGGGRPAVVAYAAVVLLALLGTLASPATAAFTAATGAGASFAAAESFGLAWWDDAWAHRAQLTVTTGSTPPHKRYRDYSAQLNMDTRPLVSAGALRSDCRDLRVARPDGDGWAQLHRTVVSCNTAGTTGYFKLQADIPDSSADDSCWLYYGNAVSDAPPADANQVFLFHDNFDFAPAGAVPPGWQVQGGGTWLVAGTWGSRFLRVDASSTGRHTIRVSGVDERDVVMQARLRVHAGSGYRFAGVMTRLRGTSSADLTGYRFGKLDSSATGKQLIRSRLLNGDLLELAAANSAWPDGGWTLMTGASHHNVLQQWVGPNMTWLGWTSNNHIVDPGAVGLHAYLWSGVVADFDDVVVRRFTLPEPEVGVGPEESR